MIPTCKAVVGIIGVTPLYTQALETWVEWRGTLRVIETRRQKKIHNGLRCSHISDTQFSPNCVYLHSWQTKIAKTLHLLRFLAPLVSMLSGLLASFLHPPSPFPSPLEWESEEIEEKERRGGESRPFERARRRPRKCEGEREPRGRGEGRREGGRQGGRSE